MFYVVNQMVNVREWFVANWPILVMMAIVAGAVVFFGWLVSGPWNIRYPP